ncbi:hypothetical protein Tco_1552362, partial [Tanacetum coccineum]
LLEKILTDHALSYAFTATPNVPAFYIQQLWRTVKQVPNANESIRFMVEKKDIIYTMDMFRATLKLPVETLKQPFIPPKTIIQYLRFTKLIIVDHTIKDDTLLVNMYTIGEVMIRGMQIPIDLLTDEIKETQAYKDYVDEYERKKKKGKQIAGESSTPKISLKIRIKQKKPIPTTPLPHSNDRERDDIIEATQLSLVVAKTAKSGGSEFADTVLLSDDDSGNRLEPESYKENQDEVINDEEKKDDDDKKKDDDDDDDDDHAD